MGKIRAVGAALVAAGMVLSGCASGDDEETATTTSPATTEPSSNPWDLPIEQRPALFDPCAELPVEAVEQGLGGPVEPVPQFEQHQPGELMACGWKSDHVEISVLSTWKSRGEYLADRTLTVVDAENELGGRAGMRLLDAIDTSERTCIQLFFTDRGTAWLRLDLIERFREFEGERFADACRALDRTIPPIMEHFPKGDFK